MCMLITRCTRGNKEAFLLPLDILEQTQSNSHLPLVLSVFNTYSNLANVSCSSPKL